MEDPTILGTPSESLCHQLSGQPGRCKSWEEQPPQHLPKLETFPSHAAVGGSGYLHDSSLSYSSSANSAQFLQNPVGSCMAAAKDSRLHLKIPKFKSLASSFMNLSQCC